MWSTSSAQKMPEGEAAFTLTGSLQHLANQAQQGKLSWKQSYQDQGHERLDTFTTEREGLQLELQGKRPLSHLTQPPTMVKDWELSVTHVASQARKQLNGATCYLPNSLSATGDPSVDTIPKLFRAAYESRGKTFDTLVPVFQSLLENLQQGNIKATQTYMRPNPAFGLPTGVKLLQVGQEGTRLEIARVGADLRLTLRHGNKTQKLNDQVLENPEVFTVLNALVAEAHRQETGQTDRGLDQF
jgi:hypothetical protein